MKELLNDVNNCLTVLSEYKIKYSPSQDNWTIAVTEKVLKILKDHLENGNNIGTRLLRASKDMYVVAFRNFDGTELLQEIDNLTTKFSSIYPEYEKLEPLGMEFGEEDPI